MSTDLFVILSSDWVDSTATRTRLGEEPADALQVLHDALLRKVIDVHGGQVVKHSGDGVLATFRSALAGLAAAIDIQREFAAYTSSAEAIAPIVARIGLAAGEVKHLTGDIFGRPVVEAVRLQSGKPHGRDEDDAVLLAERRERGEFLEEVILVAAVAAENEILITSLPPHDHHRPRIRNCLDSAAETTNG